MAKAVEVDVLAYPIDVGLFRAPAAMAQSEGLAETVETAGPGVVRVEGRRRLPASGVVWSSDGVIVTAEKID